MWHYLFTCSDVASYSSPGIYVPYTLFLSTQNTFLFGFVSIHVPQFSLMLNHELIALETNFQILQRNNELPCCIFMRILNPDLGQRPFQIVWIKKCPLQLCETEISNI
jgi:hypothetical protein